METMKRNLLFAFLSSFALAALVHAQDQAGFISIDCGIPAGASYADKVTGIKYISDANFTTTGISNNISSDIDTALLSQQFWTIRSFPDGARNCYTLKPSRGKNNKYLLRASFMYGNYDQQSQWPQFDLYLGVNLWDSVKFEDASTAVVKEIVFVPWANSIDVCLVNTGSGTPFISSLELRSLVKNTTYLLGDSESLVLYRRLDVGSTTNASVRFPVDVYDRIWTPLNFGHCKQIGTSLTIDEDGSNDYHPPAIVMATAMTPINASAPLEFYWPTTAPTTLYHVILHFTEVELLQPNQTRQFTISRNGKFWYGPVDLNYLYTSTIYSTSPVSGDQNITVSLDMTQNSTLPPILSALEVYFVNKLAELQTQQKEVEAMLDIKSLYGVKRNWQSDPCAPIAYAWEGLNCSHEDSNPPTIISLNLSSSGLSGEITPSLISLQSLQSLDLSNNNLTGTVPDFLSQLSSLTVLNLAGNKLSGSIPAALVAKSNNGLLSLSLGGNPNLCSTVSCTKKGKKKNAVVPVVASLASVFVLLMALALLWNLKRRKQVGRVGKSKPKNNNSSLESENRQFTYSEILKITNNFARILGEGGSGMVYHGYIGDTQVAVKMLSPSAVMGDKQFHAEVKLLLRVHHRNLTSLVGYCNEGNWMGLVYEYMANGNLADHISAKNPQVLNWEVRLRIALDSAQGLEYLHTGCKPPIVHRDVKSANILLNEEFQAKLADFGLSRIFPVEGGTHVSTVVAGTPGYLDPEYYGTNWLNEKSDVYSFGVVLLELITRRPVIAKVRENESIHVSQWVGFMLQKGDITSIIDPKVGGDFDVNSVWKAVELAMACVNPTSANRPTMNHAVIELKECLAIEMSRRKKGRAESSGADSKYVIETVTTNVDAELIPLAR